MLFFKVIEKESVKGTFYIIYASVDTKEKIILKLVIRKPNLSIANPVGRRVVKPVQKWK